MVQVQVQMLLENSLVETLTNIRELIHLQVDQLPHKASSNTNKASTNTNSYIHHSETESKR